MNGNTRLNKKIRTAILGFGGLGKGMARLIPHRPDFQWVAMADSQGFAYNAAGLSLDNDGELSHSITPNADSIVTLLKTYGADIDAVFMALPNLPVVFFAETIHRVATETDFSGVFVDALKRTEAVEKLFALQKLLQDSQMLYITGAGATPGFLTTVAAVAAHSFVEVLDVTINFGVGIANWEAYKATVKEDLIHLEGFDAKRVACMSDAEIDEELARRGGLLKLTEMEHADDVILEMAGVCSRDRVRVGGLVDTRNAKKPVSTTVTVTGRTAGGAVGSHQFVVSDEATMVDNVCGPALGFMLTGMGMLKRGHHGILTSADVMPRFASAVGHVPDAHPDLSNEKSTSGKILADALH
ncbi:MAG: saccharopine dehydrogenase-like oxidoreductase [Cyanobacteria bacterium P01_H01_bin.74]